MGYPVGEHLPTSCQVDDVRLALVTAGTGSLRGGAV